MYISSFKSKYEYIQKSVLNKYLKAQEEQKVKTAFEKLKVYQIKAKSISEYKKEEYQDGSHRDVFETKKTEAQTLKAKINKIDKEIDQMVYKLYDLTQQEIQIVEAS